MNSEGMFMGLPPLLFNDLVRQTKPVSPLDNHVTVRHLHGANARTSAAWNGDNDAGGIRFVWANENHTRRCYICMHLKHWLVGADDRRCWSTSWAWLRCLSAKNQCRRNRKNLIFVPGCRFFSLANFDRNRNFAFSINALRWIEKKPSNEKSREWCPIADVYEKRIELFASR